MHPIPLADCMVGIEDDDWEGVAELMLRSARKLAAIGADFLICPDNTIHQSFASVEANSPLPWLHIARVVCESGASRGFKQLGITGTKFLTEGPVYSGVAKMVDLNTVTPGIDRRNRINDIIFVADTRLHPPPRQSRPPSRNHLDIPNYLSFRRGSIAGP